MSSGQVLIHEKTETFLKTDLFLSFPLTIFEKILYFHGLQMHIKCYI